MRGVQRGGDRRALRQHLRGPVHQQHALALALEPQAGLAPAFGRLVLVVLEFGNFRRGVGRAVGQQAVQQEHVEQAHGLRRDAHGLERVEVHQAHLDVLHAALAQRMQRTLATAHRALGADGAVELVLDLQQAGAELVVVAAKVAHANGLVGRVGPRQCLVQRVGVTLQAVVAHVQAGLRVALVAQAPHAQRSGVRQVQRLALAAQRLQAVFAPLDEARAQRGRGAEQVQQHEGVAAKVADQRKVLLAAHAGQRPVVVDARDGLHAPAIAVAQAHAVDALGAADVRIAVAAQRNGLVRRQAAGHAGHPEHLAARALERAQHVLVNLGQLAQGLFHAPVGAGDELDLRFAVVGGDAGVR